VASRCCSRGGCWPPPWLSFSEPIDSDSLRPYVARGRREERHPSIFEPATLVFGIIFAVLGTIIGLELLTRVGITPNSSIIAAIAAIAVIRIPLGLFQRFRRIVNFKPLPGARAADIRVGMICSASVVGVEVGSRR